MIPESFITEWSGKVPWLTNEQVEQDLVICRALVEIFSDDFLAKRLAFRGGTALHKLYLTPPHRYSEDIDLVQIKGEPIGETIKHLQKSLEFLGKPSVSRKERNTTLKFRFESEIAPIVILRLKIETNCREHFTELGYIQMDFEVNSSWYQGKCQLTTYQLEELLGTKLRALYQRKKGRDLFDLYIAIKVNPSLDLESLIKCYKRYIALSVDNPPTQKEYIMHMDAVIKDDEFLGDIKALIRPEDEYDQEKAYELVKTNLLEKI